MRSLRIAICDDETFATTAIEDLILAYNNCHIKYDVYNDSERLLKSLESERKFYDLFLLDIDMPKLDGVNLAKNIRNIDLHSYIVFLTSHKEYMAEVFKYHTFDYLLKPITQSSLYSTIDKIQTLMSLSKFRFNFLSKGIEYSLEKEEIMYFEKKGRYAIIHEKTGLSFQIIITTKDLLNRLDEHFVQVHTSFIVNINYICGLRFDKVILKTPDNVFCDIPISRKFHNSSKKSISKVFESLY